MAQWECIVCGLIYDEKEGWPDDGIAPGTKWADVPDDWTCPDCGVGKDDFELIPGTEDEGRFRERPRFERGRIRRSSYRCGWFWLGGLRFG
jgi:rubredoxin-NAD+ reductase